MTPHARAPITTRAISRTGSRTGSRVPRDTGGRATGDPRGMSEYQWQSRVIAYAVLRGWRWYHTLDSRRSVPGFPDLVLVRDRIIFVELKRADGRLSADQQTWRDALVRAGAEWHCWRPHDWTTATVVLG